MRSRYPKLTTPLLLRAFVLDDLAACKAVQCRVDALAGRYAYSGTRADVVQDVMLVMMNAVRAGVRPQLPDPWARKVVRTTASRLRVPVWEETVDISTLEDDRVPFDDTLRPEEVKRIFDRLSQEHRTVILLRIYDGMTLPEMAEVLREEENAVKSRLKRAMKRFVRLFHEPPHRPLDSRKDWKP